MVYSRTTVLAPVVTGADELTRKDSMQTDIYRQVQQKLDQYSMGFPATESGLDQKILKYLFSESDAVMFSAMTLMPETAQEVASRLDRPEVEVSEQLEDMTENGLLFRMKSDKHGSRYSAIPFVHGLFEFQIKDIKHDLVEMVKAYSEEAFDGAMQQGAEYFLRTIPVQESIDVTHNVARYDDAIEILRNNKLIVITDCICRKSAVLLDRNCGKPMETCFMFGAMGQYYLDRGMGRKITFEEAADILAKCREAGLVTQPATSQNPGGMCNCCGDCCGVLIALNKHPKPAELILSNYYAAVGADDCTGCGACTKRCPMKAVTIDDTGIAAVNRDRCIGCGLCITTCPVETMKLLSKSDSELRIPPTNLLEQAMLMAQKRGLVLHK